MKDKKAAILDSIRANRMVYDPPIRESIELNDLDHMKAVLKQAQKIHADQAESIARLVTAIKKLT